MAPSAPNSLRALLCDYADLRAAGRPFAVASVVGVEGSAFRKEGARLLAVPAPGTDFAGVTDEPHTWGRVARAETRGSISGGCFEGEVAFHALDAVRTGRARVVALTSALGDADRAAFGIGCGGTVHVLVQPVSPGDVGPLDALVTAARSRQSGALAVVTKGPAGRVGEHLFVSVDGNATGTLRGDEFRSRVARETLDALAEGVGRAVSVPTASGDALSVRVDVVRPPLHLAVFGTGLDARALVRQAALLGWETSAVGASSVPEVARAVPEADHPLAAGDGLPDRLTLDDRTAAVVMTHNFARDRDLVAALARSRAAFLGLLGSRRRTARLVADLAEAGVDLPEDRLRSPVGLDIGSETPEEIALATCAEVLGLLRRAGLPAPALTA